MGSLLWWTKNIVIAVVAVFFATIAFLNLISAYQMKNPLEFIMTFFSQSLMLMISVVGVIYAVLQMYYYLKKDKG